MRRQTPFRKRFACAVLAAIIIVPGVKAQGVDDSLRVVSETNLEAAESQQKIDRLSRESAALLEEYRRLKNSADYQAAYTRELQQISIAQESRIETLRQQIEETRITQQRIAPLMRNMADSLQKFVVLDLPFHHEERITAMLELNRRLRQADLSLPAKFRLLLEAYQLEQDYGVTIEAWRAPLVLDNESLSVEFLRIGRVALYYQSLDGQDSGFWDATKQAWTRLDRQYNQAISEALRVAKKQLAPRLLNLPMAPPPDAP